MKKIIFLMVSLALSATLLACSDSQESHSSRSPHMPAPEPVVCCKPPPAPSKKVFINGEPADEFYAKLFYKRLSQCPRAHYRSLTSDSFFVGQDRFGRRLEGTLKLAIYEGGTYEVYYSEASFRNWTVGSPIAEIVSEQFKGSWKIEGAEIVLDGLGKGRGVRYLGKRRILLTVDRDLIHDGLQGKLVQLTTEITDYAPMKLTDCN